MAGAKKRKAPGGGTPESRNPTDCFYYLVSRATLTVTSALRKGLSAVGAEGVKPAYLGALMCLWNEDGQHAIDLGRKAGLEPSTMTGLVDRMEEDGLVSREDDPDDRRAQRIFLTERGKRAECPVLAAVDQTLDRMTEGIPERDIQKTKAILKRFLANVAEGRR